MELIKKTIKQIMTTGITATCTGNCRTIIPDLKAVYHIKILLTSESQDIGFFDADTGSTTNNTTWTLLPTITGTSTSRLSELRKYTITSNFNNQYVSSAGNCGTCCSCSCGSSIVSDGVDYHNSSACQCVVYYLGGIRYIDRFKCGVNNCTTFSYTPQGTNSPDFINAPIFKDPNKDNIISNPKIINDVFITRQELSAFDKNYKLEYMKSLVDIETYAAGKFFNIVKNT